MSARVPTVARMPARDEGWVYTSFRWRDADGDFAQWVESIVAAGWERSEYGSGAWAEVDGRRSFGLTVRRPSARPWATGLGDARDDLPR